MLIETLEFPLSNGQSTIWCELGEDLCEIRRNQLKTRETEANALSLCMCEMWVPRKTLLENDSISG